MDENLKLLVAQVAHATFLLMVGAAFAEELNKQFFGYGNVIIRIIATLVLMFLFSGAIWAVEYIGMINGVFGCALAGAGGTLWTWYACKTGLIFEV